MAPQQSADGKIKAFERPPFAEGLKRILGAGRGEPAGGREKGGDADLVKSDQPHERGYGDLLYDVPGLTHRRVF